MNNQLSHIFNSKYESIQKNDEWKDFLKQLFRNQESSFYNTPIEKIENKKSHEKVKTILEFGDLTLSDDSRILFYEVELKKEQRITSRVALRNIIHADVIPGDVDGIIATYFNPDSNDWRLTFISKSLYWDDEFNEIKEETNPKRYTYVLGEGESTKTALFQFEWLFNQINEREIKLEDLIKTFSVEKISNEFFDGYFDQFIAFTDYITDNPSAFSFFTGLVDKNKSDKEQQEEAEKFVRHFVKKLLGRIVFLYFLQKKGWLGVPKTEKWGEGDKKFMSDLFFNYTNKPNFYKEVLKPLFFETLNTDRKANNDVFPLTNSRVPYLNGGLFEKDKIEPDNIQFKPNLFEALFNFFDQYNFTVDENSPDDKDIGIDPEMLGLIFENLLEDNKDKGTFYTPKEVVHFMCKESLSSYLLEELKAKCSKEELTEIHTLVFENGKVDLKVIEKFADDLDRALSKIKICDPAIGSGAFPMGMVYEIFRLKRIISSYLDVKDFIYLKEKLKIIRNSIYGVDIDKGAVDIARLRFWLSLIVDEQEPQPLPNLDYKIMQGDSLRESFENIALDQMMEEEKAMQKPQLTLGDEFNEPQQELYLSVSDKNDLRKWVDQYFSLEPLVKKKELHKKIDSAVMKHIHGNVTFREKDIKKEIQNLENKYLSAGKNIGLLKSGKDVKNYQNLKKELKETEAQEKRLLKVQETTDRPYFLWNLFFGNVLGEGNKGFDIVIGNPPYGGTKIDDEVRDHYGLQSKDPYGAFISMALQKLVKTNGTLCYIVSDTWLTISSHRKLRQQVLNHELKKVIRLHQDCFKATVNSCIFTVVKRDKISENNEIIAGDLTNISTRKQIPEFREKLLNLRNYPGQYSPEFAVYKYKQKLLKTNSNIPIVVGSPKLFALINDSDCTIKKKIINRKDLEIRQVTFNNQKLEIVRFGNVAEVRQGLATGDNKYYLYQKPEARGTYRDINKYQEYLLIAKDLNKIHQNETIRSKIIEKGIYKVKNHKDFDPDCYFEGRFIVPYDKGGESDTDSGWLPNYNVPTNYFIDWSSDAVDRLKSYKIADRIRDRNENKTIKDHYETTNAAVIRSPETYFKHGISFSRTGVYSPSFRINSVSTYDTEGSTIFMNYHNTFASLGVLSSKLLRYILKVFIGHTVHTQVDEIKESPFILEIPEKVSLLVKSIIEQQNSDLRYNYFKNEQKDIDKLVYTLYGLNEDDINEVETWFARRYPKLADYAYFKSPEELLDDQMKKSQADGKILQLIENGESKTVEFKSTLRYCLRKNSPQKNVEHSAMKNLAAFLNTEGGTLFLGVDDDGNVLGLEETDFQSFKDENKKDGFVKHFDNLIQNYFGNDMAHKFTVEFESINGKSIAIVHIKDRANSPVVIRNQEKNKEEFYVRRNASAIALTMHETLNYTKENWN